MEADQFKNDISFPVPKTQKIRQPPQIRRNYKPIQELNWSFSVESKRKWLKDAVEFIFAGSLFVLSFSL